LRHAPHLQDAISRQAQAGCEKEARVILGSTEAAERRATILIPSALVAGMNPGDILSLAK
jgi:hypothetical protein